MFASPISLSEFNALVKDVLNEAFPEKNWVTAEIAECKTNASGHCYLELIEKKAGSDQLLARSKAVIWANVWYFLSAQFQLSTGVALSRGQKVLIEVEEGNEEELKVGDVIDLEPNQLQLDENGEATYKWKPGLANITPPYTRTLSITYEIGGKINTWKFDDKDFMEAIILGSLPTGSNFVTQGPDQLIMVLRDPPGSGSNAEWTSGSVVARETAKGPCWSSENTVRATASSGGDVTLVVGTGVAYEQKTSTKNDYTIGAKVVTEGENSKTKSYTLTTSKISSSLW